MNTRTERFQAGRGGALVVALLGVLLSAGPALSGGMQISFVTVGDPGNPCDATGFGAVSTSYRIGMYEVTNGQYTAFLNAVAATDTVGLYSAQMSILRSGSPGTYTYSTQEENKPVTHVTWYDALRFTNWLANGQPTGAQGPSTTEDGAYTFTGPTTVGGRNPGARVFLPNQDEWYKAAYFTGGPGAGYRDFPTQGAAPPSPSPPADIPDAANYDDAVGGVTDVGAYPASAGHYGTFDQAGNVWEWIEDAAGSERGLRGGSWNDYDLLLNASYSDAQDPGLELEFVGFRVTAIPAPTGQEVQFVRGNVNGDLVVDISDAISVLNYLFVAGASPSCLSAADANDDRAVDISDGIFILTTLFTEGGLLPPPYPGCGKDPTPDELSCEVHSGGCSG